MLLPPLRLSTARLRRSWPIPANVGAGSTTVRRFTQISWTLRRPIRSASRMIPDRGLVTSPVSMATPVGSRGSGRKIVVGLIGTSALVVLVGVGGTVAYARYFDPELRNRLEKDHGGILSPLPTAFSGWILDRVFGPKSTGEASGQQKQPQQLQLSTKEKAIQSGLLQRKLAREAAAATKEEPATNSKIQDPLPPQTASAEEDKTKKISPVITSVGPEKHEPVRDQKDLKPASRTRIVSSDASVGAENEAIERLVKESVRDLESVVSSAIGAYEQASRNVRSEDAKEKSAALATAETKAVEARAALQRIKDVVEQGRKSKLTSSNRAIIDAEEAANRAIYALQKAEAEVTLAGSETNVLSEYKKLAQEGRRKVLSEMNVGEQGEIGDQVELLRKQIVAQQNGEQYRVQKALDAQRQEYENLANKRINMELQRQQRELEIVYHKKLVDLNDEYEQELLQQLRRQAAAHSEHLQDVLEAQEEELVADYGRRLDDLVMQAKHDFQTELAGSLGRLDGINVALKARSELDVATHRAQRLWVACQALKHSILNGKPQASSWEDQRKPLSSIVSDIRKAAGNDDKFVSVVLSSVPEKALSDGVFTESALKDRFLRVNDACRKVALVGEQDGSLYLYVLSYLQSLLLTSRRTLAVSAEEEELAKTPSIDVDALNTFEILERARRCLDRGNMELALRYMNQLKGAPRAVARDWLVEARLLLEVNQVVDALLARAAASEVQSVAQ